MQTVLKIGMKENFSNNKITIDYRFKIVYAIAMISVISEHCKGKASIELHIQGWFKYSSYHMPLFMFSAGYFFKNKYVSHIFYYIFTKFKKLIFPIHIYNLFYGIYLHVLTKFGFKYISNFSFRILFIKPLAGSGFRNINPSWFSSTLFYVETYNVIKRKIFAFLKTPIHESIYFVFDLFSFKYIL